VLHPESLTATHQRDLPKLPKHQVRTSRLRGATVARQIPDLKAACSNHVGVTCSSLLLSLATGGNLFGGDADPRKSRASDNLGNLILSITYRLVQPINACQSGDLSSCRDVSTARIGHVIIFRCGFTFAHSLLAGFKELDMWKHLCHGRSAMKREVALREGQFTSHL
jgi:hypothetical protein